MHMYMHMYMWRGEMKLRRTPIEVNLITSLDVLEVTHAPAKVLPWCSLSTTPVASFKAPSH